MKKRGRSQKGYTLVELLIVLALLGIVAGMLTMLLGTGSSIFRRITGDYASQSDARTAISYIMVKVRQNDSLGGITYDGSALKIMDATTAGEYWKIYYDATSRMLKEERYDSTGLLQKRSDIAEVNGVSFSSGSYGITITVDYDGGTMTKDITYRSG